MKFGEMNVYGFGDEWGFRNSSSRILKLFFTPAGLFQYNGVKIRSSELQMG